MSVMPIIARGILFASPVYFP